MCNAIEPAPRKEEYLLGFLKKGKPVIVGGDPERRDVVAFAAYEA